MVRWVALSAWLIFPEITVSAPRTATDPYTPARAIVSDIDQIVTPGGL